MPFIHHCLSGHHPANVHDPLAAEAFHSRETTELVAAYHGIADRKLRRAIARLILAMSKTPPH